MADRPSVANWREDRQPWKYLRKPMRLGVRFCPAGPRRRRCAVCGVALNKNTLSSLPGPALVAGKLCLGGLFAPVCRQKHMIYPARQCVCGALYFAVPGPVYLEGTLAPRELLLNARGEELGRQGDAYECPGCWALLPQGAEGNDG